MVVERWLIVEGGVLRGCPVATDWINSFVLVLYCKFRLRKNLYGCVNNPNHQYFYLFSFYPAFIVFRNKKFPVTLGMEKMKHINQSNKTNKT